MEEKHIVRIGDLATALGVERSVIRFWEKEFGIRTRRSDGGQRYYNTKDVQKFEAIKELLYAKGFTISGAKKHLKDMKIQSPSTPSPITLEPATHAPEAPVQIEQATPHMPESIAEQMADLQQKLIKLRELL